MPKFLHKMRSRRFRLLASLLVTLAILCNGVGLAQAHSMPAKKDCCAEMMAHKMSPDKPCSLPDKNCDDQCMARCMSANGVLFSMQLTISTNVLISSLLPQHGRIVHSLASLGPNLRPPIFS
ncbi:MAG: hypothetical protein ABIP02_05675 [Arenimonas sp.]